MQTLNKLNKDKSFPDVYNNAIHAIWLDYSTEYLAVQDINLISYQNEIIENYKENERLIANL